MKDFIDFASIIVTFIAGIISTASLFLNIITTLLKRKRIIYDQDIITFKQYLKKYITIMTLGLVKFQKKRVDKEINKILKRDNIISKQEQRGKKIKKQDSVIEELFIKKKKTYNHAIKLMFIAALLYCIINIIFDINIKNEVIILLDIVVVLMIISQLLISYRIKKGYFGTNYDEAKEILIYLIENNDKNDKNSGKKIFNEIDENKAKDIVPVPAPVPDGGL